MIARIWHGRTKRERGDEYAAFLEARAIPDYRSVAGNRGVHVLRRDAGGESHFLTLTFWDSEATIRAFAGEPIARAKYYAEDPGFLLELEPEVTHYAVVASADPAGTRLG